MNVESSEQFTGVDRIVVLSLKCLAALEWMLPAAPAATVAIDSCLMITGEQLRSSNNAGEQLGSSNKQMFKTKMGQICFAPICPN
jgi:hypothetical protein